MLLAFRKSSVKGDYDRVFNPHQCVVIKAVVFIVKFRFPSLEQDSILQVLNSSPKPQIVNFRIPYRWISLEFTHHSF